MVQLRPARLDRFRRDAWLEVNLDNLEYNLNYLYNLCNKPLIPVIKADAYGHGAEILAKVLDTYDFVFAYATASIDEALALRKVSSKKIMVLGICPDWAIESALENDIDLTLTSMQAAERLSLVAIDMDKLAKIHLKIDTGMNRIGFKTLEQKDLCNIEKLQSLQIESLYTHMADSEDIEFSKKQLDEFETITSGLDYPKHPVSTKAFTALADDFEQSEESINYVRCGIELYGLDNPELKPLLSLHARISHVKEIQAGESVSYKRTWTAEKPSKIATLPLGYADGIPRALSNKIQAYCNGKKLPQIGMITMDQMMFDITDTDIKLGDSLELIGENISIYQWLEHLDTISYELVCALNLRLPKIYKRN